MNDARQIALAWQESLFGRSHGSTLPEICLGMRMAANGSADPWPTEVVRTTVGMLEARVETWQDSRQGEKEFDDAVLAMVKAAIAYGKSHLGEQSK